MNSATLKTLRELVGLSQQQAARLAGVTLRTWQYWEAPSVDGDAKPDVAGMLAERLAQIVATVHEIPDYAAMDNPPVEVTVTRYRTQDDLDAVHPGYPGGLDAHAAAVRQVLFELALQDIPARVVWDDDPAATIRPEPIDTATAPRETGL